MHLPAFFTEPFRLRTWKKTAYALIALPLGVIWFSLFLTLGTTSLSLIVFVVVGILALFAIVTIANMDVAYLAPSGYPGARDIISSVALTFFAVLGFGVVGTKTLMSVSSVKSCTSPWEMPVMKPRVHTPLRGYSISTHSRKAEDLFASTVSMICLIAL